jgi:glutamine cyclotransferase
VPKLTLLAALLLAPACRPAPAPGAPAPGAATPGGAVAEGAAPAGAGVEPAPRLGWRIVAQHPHDPRAFTQGLLWHDGRLYESTGGYGVSDLRRVDLVSGEVEETAPLSRHFFGEGLALAGGRLVQLTWREGVALLWDPRTLEPLGERPYQGEGWGLTTVGARLLQSDGTSRLTWRDAETMQPLGELTVTDAGREVSLLNELEAVEGAVWANVWHSDELVRLDPADGRVEARLDLSPLRAVLGDPGDRSIDVLNGIAWRPETRTLLVTGKLWPVLFELRLDEPR